MGKHAGGKIGVGIMHQMRVAMQGKLGTRGGGGKEKRYAQTGMAKDAVLM